MTSQTLLYHSHARSGPRLSGNCIGCQESQRLHLPVSAALPEVYLNRLGHAVEDEPHPHRSDEEADDAGRCVDPARTDTAEDLSA